VQSIRGGRYVLMGALGQGSQGRTFDGVDKREGRPVAIKRFDVRGAAAWKDVELAEREVRVLQSLSHPRLPRYVDSFEEDGALYLVMEKIEGESLAALRKRGGSLSEAEVVRLLQDASEVLKYLHGHTPPVIHRDLKPGNLIRRPDGSFAFVDFGAVRDKLRPEGGSTVVGTFGFMAPEQFQGRALPASDVYALGATAVSMLTGREPEELPHKGLAIDVRAALAGRVGERLTNVLANMLEPDPDRRAREIGSLLEHLRARDARSMRNERAERGSRQDRYDHQRSDRRDREVRDSERRAHRQERWRARREARAARREARRRRFVPWPFSFLLTLAFGVSIVLVSLATQVVAPIVLLLLAVVFGRGMREAAEAVRDAGKAAIRGLNVSRRWLAGKDPSDKAASPPDARVDDDGEIPSSRRLRVSEDGGEPARLDDEDEPGDAHGRERR
jgi:serine/threonine protein kinase